MLLGHYCNEPFPIGTLETKRANNILQSFKFIGLSERWNATICLYHKMFKIAKPIDWSFQGVNSRPGHYEHHTRDDLLVNYVNNNMQSDVLLYATAMDIFTKYLEFYPECKNL